MPISLHSFFEDQGHFTEQHWIFKVSGYISCESWKENDCNYKYNVLSHDKNAYLGYTPAVCSEILITTPEGGNNQLIQISSPLLTNKHISSNCVATMVMAQIPAMSLYTVTSNTSILCGKSTQAMRKL